MGLLSNLLKIGGAGLAAAAIPFTGGASGALLPGLLAGGGAAAGALGSVLGGAGAGRAAERGGRNVFEQNANRDVLNRYGTQQNALLTALMARDRGAMDRYGTRQVATTNATQGRQNATTTALGQQSQEGLQRAELGLRAPSVRAQQSIQGSLMRNLQPVRIQGPAGQRGHETTLTGGLSASALDPITRQHGEALMRSALQAQLSGSDIPEKTDFLGGIQDWNASVLEPPEATDYTTGVLTPPELTGYQEPGGLETGLSAGGTIGAIIQALLAQAQQPMTTPRSTPPPVGAG